MKVATWQGEDRFTIDKAPEPVAGPGQVVVAVHAAGICGTDVHATQGLFPWKPPLVLGHEYTGVVREVGRGVSKNLVGRTVGCEPSYGCGKCAACAAGRVSQCPQCVRVGGFAERVALPARNVHPLPRGLDFLKQAVELVPIRSAGRFEMIKFGGDSCCARNPARPRGNVNRHRCVTPWVRCPPHAGLRWRRRGHGSREPRFEHLRAAPLLHDCRGCTRDRWRRHS